MHTALGKLLACVVWGGYLWEVWAGSVCPALGGAIMLAEMYKLQAELNRRIGHDTEALRDSFDPQRAGLLLNDYIMAAANELEELRNCTFWKHWCQEAKDGRRFELHDLQNARVEVIDLFFFVISMAQCVGLSAEEVFDLYKQKLDVNHARQAGGYSMAHKNEADNRDIKLSH